MQAESKEFGNTETLTVSFVETDHGRLRREQRGIDKKALQAAKTYGAKRKGSNAKNGDPTAVYTYNSIVYVTNEKTGEERTSYALPLELEYVPISSNLQRENNEALQKIKLDEESWLSNTVMVIDVSGSMKESDVWGARTRLDAVRIAIALDFIAQRLQARSACPMDVVSIVTLGGGKNSSVIIHEQPCSWVL
jgi:Mg-chelatase subunit ChlD